MANPTGKRNLSTKGFNRSKTAFEHQWGVHVLEIAEMEDKHPEAIYQRVYRFGSPFQRKLNPSAIEKHYGKTREELATELGMHPLTVEQKHRKQGSAFHKWPRTDSSKGWTSTDHSWKTDPKFTTNPWLMEIHPDYEDWRAGKLFADVHQNKPLDY